MRGLFILLSVVAVVVVVEVLIRRTEYSALRKELRDARRAGSAAPAADLSVREKVRLRRRLWAWVALHPEPNKSVIAFAQRGHLSPADILDAVEAETEDGKLFIAMVASGLKYTSFDRILDCFVPREMEADVH